MHWAARKGAVKAVEFILKLRADSVFDTDKKVWKKFSAIKADVIQFEVRL